MNYTDLHVTDWLGSNLVFYNEVSGVHSNIFSDVLKESNLEIDPIELQNYFKYGFSFNGKTPIRNIRYTLPNTTLRQYSDGRILEIQQQDPVENLIGKQSSERNLHDRMESWATEFFAQNSSNVVILPLSGGLDSRMLAVHSKNQPNVFSFTYGITLNQAKSSEVTVARQVAKACDINWQQIQIGNFHNFLELNNSLYGLSTHAHSMYHFEFYKQIREQLGNSQSGTVLSGIYGDVWAGSWSFPEINHPGDVRKLAVTHGMVGAKSQIFDPFAVSITEEIYFKQNAEKLKDPLFRIVAAARLKIILIRHLIATPEYFGYSVESPFLNLDIASGMLNLDPSRRINRTWQSEFLDKKLPRIREKSYFLGNFNVSDLQATFKVPVPELVFLPESPTELRLLNAGEVCSNLKIRKINYLLILFFSLPIIDKFKPSFKFLNFKENYANYMTLFPIFNQFGRAKL